MTGSGLTAAGVAHDPAMEKAEEMSRFSRSAYGEHAALFALSDLAGRAP